MAIVTGTINRPRFNSGDVSFPASYAAGGFTVDLTADFDIIHFFEINPIIGSTLQDATFEYSYNRNTTTDALGIVLVKIMRNRYDQASIGNVSGNPAGTATQAALFAAGTTTGSAHTHTLNHTHGTVTSATETASGALGINLAAGGGNMRNHTHVFTVALMNVTSSSATHSHNRAFEYEHSHTTTQVSTNLTSIEIAGGTNLSGVNARYYAVGV